MAAAAAALALVLAVGSASASRTNDGGTLTVDTSSGQVAFRWTLPSGQWPVNVVWSATGATESYYGSTILTCADPTSSCSPPSADSYSVDGKSSPATLPSSRRPPNGTYYFQLQSDSSDATHGHWLNVVGPVTIGAASGGGGASSSGGGSAGGGTSGTSGTSGLTGSAGRYCCSEAHAQARWSAGSLALGWTNPPNFCPGVVTVGLPSPSGYLVGYWEAHSFASACATSCTLAEKTLSDYGTWTSVLDGRAAFQITWVCQLPAGRACGSPPLDANSEVLLSGVSLLPAAPSGASGGGTSTGGSQARTIGTVATVRGTVEVEQADGSWKRLQPGDQVQLDAHVRTSSDGRFEVALRDNTSFRMGPNTDMVLDRFVYEPKTTTGTVFASVVKGLFRWVTGRISGQKKMKLDASDPVGAIGTRGTDFVGAYDPTTRTTTLLVHEGSVVFTPKAGGAPTVVLAGHRAVLDRHGKGKVASLTAAAWAAAVGRT